MADGKSSWHHFRDTPFYNGFHVIMMVGMFAMAIAMPGGFLANMVSSLWSGITHIPAALATVGQGALNLAHGAGWLTSVSLPPGLAESLMPASSSMHAGAAAAAPVVTPTGMETHAAGAGQGMAAAPDLNAAWMKALSPDLQTQFSALQPDVMDKFNHLSTGLRDQFIEQLPSFSNNGLSLTDAINTFCIN